MTTVTQAPSAAAAAPNLKDQSPSTISKALVHETTLLKDDATGWARKLQELELHLKKDQDVEAEGKDINECLVVSPPAAVGRLAPDAWSQGGIAQTGGRHSRPCDPRGGASGPDNRNTRRLFSTKDDPTAGLDNCSVEEIRTRLVTQIDRLEELKIQLEFNRTAAQIGEAVKGGEVSLDDMQAITEDARRIAADLDGFGRASTVLTEPSEAAKPFEVAKPVEVMPISGTLRNGPRSRNR